jgi:hypothetical protein
MTMMSKPNGSRIQRPRRKLAEARRRMVNRLRQGREWAEGDLLAHARHRALSVRMPKLPPRNRIARWLFDKAAEVVAREIERQTFNAAFRRLEASKVGGRDWKNGIWFWVNVMKGNIAV